MKNADGIYTEIRKFVSDKIDAGIAIRHDWIASEFMAAHSRIDGADVEIYRYCTLVTVSKIVRAVMGRYDKTEASIVDAQIVLPGFERLQKAYSVEREGKQIIVPIDQLDDSELLLRAAEYDDMAEGCRKHAAEIRAFVRKRKTAKKAVA